jgi:hypothetical protein
MTSATARALLAALLVLTFCLAPAGAVSRQKTTPSPRSDSRIPVDQIESAVHAGFGARVVVMKSEQPFYLLADFNGDGKDDIAVLVNIETALDEIAAHEVKFMNIDPYSKQNGSELDPKRVTTHNCNGVAIIHGSEAGWATPVNNQRFIFYECFSPFSLVRRQASRQRPTTRRSASILKRDAIQLDLESGGRTIVYWDGQAYKGRSMRRGD